MITEEEIIELLQKRLGPKRLKHSLSVAETAERLANKEGVSIKKARFAALLHDYAKPLENDELKKYAVKLSEKIDKVEAQLLQVLHAPVGAYLVSKEFGINDKEVLEAIRFHTIGSPEMGKLAQIIFVADVIEPDRDFPGINKIRSKLDQGLIPTVITVCDFTITYNIKKRYVIHPNTLLLRNVLLGGSN